MGNVNCFSASSSVGKNTNVKRKKGFKTLHVNIENSTKSFEESKKSTSFTVPVNFGIAETSRCNVKVMSLESPEHAYEGEDEHDESISIKKINSDSDLRSGDSLNDLETRIKKEEYSSDPGFSKAEFSTSPMLKRSCSDCTNLLMREKIKTGFSFEDPIQKLSERFLENNGSPVRSHCSADKVMLKKHSSSQILPSRSRKIWWKLFLWSHRNVYNSGYTQAQPKLVINQQGGYTSDTLEARNLSTEEESIRIINDHNHDNHSWDGLKGISNDWSQNQWVAFPEQSSAFSRVDQWVKEQSVVEPLDEKHDQIEDGKDMTFTQVPTKSSRLNLPEEILHANSVIQSLNSSSTVAHIAGIGLKVIPSISCFSSLRSVNLSGNFIAHISPGSLPKGLHVLNLSRNKINTIEGLRELTRLRVLDLSYNKISRFGQGLSNCTLIKELYIGGNKISEVEGLHRLLKLTILDLSFNKVSTTKALGQLVANYNSLLALNLIGNPIQSNINEDQLRKTMCSLLPKLAFLNRQPINPQKAREVRSEAIVRAATGDSSRSSRKKSTRRVSIVGGSASSSVHNKNRHRSKSTTRGHHSSLKKSSSHANIAH